MIPPKAGNPRLWEDANRAILHPGYAISTDRMAGKAAAPGDATVWALASGLDVLLTVWWVRLKPRSISSADVFPILITMQPEDYTALDQAAIDEKLLDQAHALAENFLRDAGLV